MGTMNNETAGTDKPYAAYKADYSAIGFLGLKIYVYFQIYHSDRLNDNHATLPNAIHWQYVLREIAHSSRCILFLSS